ncbi:hypothetical protein F5Y18DRAFT_19268 [Xylariaceae sp. FL1019]|nr:hypothetical protein F5Y18DRAFT_19268 [Xylariaceae sp. FL1019]
MESRNPHRIFPRCQEENCQAYAAGRQYCRNHQESRDAKETAQLLQALDGIHSSMAGQRRPDTNSRFTPINAPKVSTSAQPHEPNVQEGSSRNTPQTQSPMQKKQLSVKGTARKGAKPPSTGVSSPTSTGRHTIEALASEDSPGSGRPAKKPRLSKSSNESEVYPSSSGVRGLPLSPNLVPPSLKRGGLLGPPGSRSQNPEPRSQNLGAVDGFALRPKKNETINDISKTRDRSASTSRPTTSTSSYARGSNYNGQKRSEPIDLTGDDDPLPALPNHSSSSKGHRINDIVSNGQLRLANNGRITSLQGMGSNQSHSRDQPRWEPQSTARARHSVKGQNEHHQELRGGSELKHATHEQNGRLPGGHQTGSRETLSSRPRPNASERSSSRDAIPSKSYPPVDDGVDKSVFISDPFPVNEKNSAPFHADNPPARQELSKKVVGRSATRSPVILTHEGRSASSCTGQSSIAGVTSLSTQTSKEATESTSGRSDRHVPPTDSRVKDPVRRAAEESTSSHTSSIAAQSKDRLARTQRALIEDRNNPMPQPVSSQMIQTRGMERPRTLPTGPVLSHQAVSTAPNIVQSELQRKQDQSQRQQQPSLMTATTKASEHLNNETVSVTSLTRGGPLLPPRSNGVTDQMQRQQPTIGEAMKRLGQGRPTALRTSQKAALPQVNKSANQIPSQQQPTIPVAEKEPEKLHGLAKPGMSDHTVQPSQPFQMNGFAGHKRAQERSPVLTTQRGASQYPSPKEVPVSLATSNNDATDDTVSPAATPMINGTSLSLRPGQWRNMTPEERRQYHIARHDPRKFDALIYSENNRPFRPGDPLFGVPLQDLHYLQPNRPKPRPAKYWAHINPLVYYTQERSEAWLQQKQKEIAARGTRKARISKPIERSAKPTIEAGAPEFDYDSLPQRVKDNPKWVEAAKYMFEQEQKLKSIRAKKAQAALNGRASETATTTTNDVRAEDMDVDSENE